MNPLKQMYRGGWDVIKVMSCSDCVKDPNTDAHTGISSEEGVEPNLFGNYICYRMKNDV